jgi:dTDP-glucose 4,6-dehydratase
MKTILVTGGAGFIGSNFIHFMMNKYADYKIVNFDALTYAGNPDNLKSIERDPRYNFIKGDIASAKDVAAAMKGVDRVVHFAAESHVDRSITGPEIFTVTNVLGTQVLLDHAKEYGIQKFVHVSTDEVHGSLGATGRFTEDTPLAPNSPYSASKAGSDLMVRSYFKTYGFPAIITRCSNNYGPNQFPEKLIPLMIKNAQEDKSLPVYGDGMNVRDWLYVEDHCSAIDRVLHDGKIGEVYNIGGNNEWHNIDIVKLILKELGKPETLITCVEDRLGHDRRYAIDASKIKNELGWEPSVQFPEGIKKTIQWYIDNPEWVRRVVSGEYREIQHGSRIAKSQELTAKTVRYKGAKNEHMRNRNRIRGACNGDVFRGFRA